MNFKPNSPGWLMRAVFALFFVFFSANGGLYAQIFNMSNGTITTCSGIFEDDGLGGGAYSNNAYTFTICPDNPGDVVQLDFTAFALFVSPNPNNSDRLFVYDGDSPAANSLGSYGGNSLQGIPISGTVNNVTGCLTFVFAPTPSSPGGFPGWSANISCTTPCANPTASSAFLNPMPQSNNSSIGICLGQEITLQDNGSAAQAGFSIQNYIWRWGDGTETIVNTPTQVSHTYDEPGEYIITHFVQDNNGCFNLNIDPKQVLVSTIPIFNTAFETPVCVGSSTNIDGNPIQSITWTALPPQVAAEQIFLADGAGFSYSSGLLFDYFEPGAVLENCSDLLQINMNIEHSFLGDLSISIACPNGDAVNILNYPNSGGGAYLGEAVDDDFDATAPGVGYDYGWSPTSTNGFIDNNANWTLTAFTNAVGGNDNNNIVNPGIYQSEENLCNLVGCPLNGEWTITITDNIASDNGYLFSWGIDFNPLLLPGVTTFTPIIGLQADSTFWEGSNIINTSTDGNSIEVLFDTPGLYEYTFFATNNFGCTFDTTVVIEAVVGPDITAGPDLFLCDEPAFLQAGLAGFESASCSIDGGLQELCYGNDENLVFTYCPDNPGDGVTFMTINFISGTIENFFDNIAVFDGPSIASPVIIEGLGGNLAGQSFSATNPDGCITFQLTSDVTVSCATGNFGPIIYNVGCLPGGGLVYQWSPAEGLSDPNVQNPMVFVEQTTVYTLSAFPPDLPGCVLTDQVVVGPDPSVNPGLDTDTIVCFNSPQTNLTSYLRGTPATSGIWTNNATGAVLPNQFNPTSFPNGTVISATYTVNNGQCEKTAVLNLTVLEATNPDCCLTNSVAGQDDVACDLVYELKAFPTIGFGTWSGPPNVSFSNINDPNATVTTTAPGGSITLTWTDTVDQFCQTSDDVTIVFAVPLETVLIPTDARCNGECSGSAIAIPSGGTPDASGIYNYLWPENTTPGLTGQIAEGLCAGEQWVTVVDNVGCRDSVVFTLSEPDAQTIVALGAPPLCADSCNGRITITSPGAVDYSFDDGLTWQEGNVGLVCAGLNIVYARDEAGCQIQAMVNLTDPPPFVASFNINPNPATIRNTLIQFQNTSTPGPLASSLWLFGENGSAGTSTDRMTQWRFPVDTSGTYPITLFTESVNGCRDTLTQLLVINDDLLWFVPNSFSPNQDGINEIWKPQGSFIDLTDYRLDIFDRWGQRIFHTTEFNEGWNGSVNGSAYFADMGIYTYFIKVTSTTTEEVHEITGFIVLIR